MRIDNDEKKPSLISVIIPVYNAETYMDQCISSVLSQKHSNLEIILVDDGSSDRSGAICDTWAENDQRVIVFHKKNGGASSARNIGLSKATGEIIAFVDSDDWLPSDAYESMYQLMISNQADMVIGNVAICKQRNIQNRADRNKKIQEEVWDHNEGLNRFFQVKGTNRFFGMWRRLIRRELLDGYQFIEGKMNEDIHSSYWIMMKCKKAVYTTKIVYNYYLNKGGVTNCKFNKKKLDLVYIWDLVREMVNTYTPEFGYACEMNRKRAYFTLLAKMYIDGYDKGDLELQKIQKELKMQVRCNYWELMRWRMPISRKILMSILVL